MDKKQALSLVVLIAIAAIGIASFSFNAFQPSDSEIDSVEEFNQVWNEINPDCSGDTCTYTTEAGHTAEIRINGETCSSKSECTDLFEEALN